MTVVESQTSAQRFLEELQAADPPAYPINRHGHDRARALAQKLVPVLPEQLREMFGNGGLVVGEVGEWEPDIRTLSSPPLDQGDFAIIMHSGIMDFYYAVARAANLSMIVNGVSPSHRVAGQEVAQQIAYTFREWRQHCKPNMLEAFIDLFSPNQRIGQTRLPISEDARRVAEYQANQAEIFMLAHEFGHVAIDTGLFEANFDDEESTADAFGADYFFKSLPGNIALREALSGLGFAIRVTDSLQRIGVRFSKAYPAPEKRLWQQLQRVRDQQISQQYFDEMSTLLVSTLDQMDDVDGMIDDDAPEKPPAYSDWQARVRMIAVLEATTTGSIPPELFYGMCEELQHFEPPETVGKVGAELVEYYVRAENPIDDERSSLRVAMGYKLRELVRGAPKQIGKIFPI